MKVEYLRVAVVALLATAEASAVRAMVTRVFLPLLAAFWGIGQ